MSKETKNLVFRLMILFLILGFILGIPLGMTIQSYLEEMYPKVTYNGFWHYTEKGEWIVINIDDGNYTRAMETASHEIGHAIFANYCETNIDKCMNLTNKNE